MKYLSLLAISAIISVAKGFIVSYAISKEQFALYSIGLLWSQIAVIILPFGSITKTQLLAVKYLEEKRYNAIIKLFSKNLSFIIVNFFFLIFIASLVYSNNQKMLYPSLIGIVTGLFQAIFLLLITLTKSNQKFRYYSFICLMKSILVIFFVSVISFICKVYYLIYFAEVSALCVVIFFLYKNEFIMDNYKLGFRKFKLKWYKENSSLFIVGISAILFANFDRIVILEKANMSQIATLGFVGLFYGAASMFQATVNSIFFPRAVKINLNENSKKLISTSILYSIFAFLIIFFISICVFHFFETLILNIFSKYEINLEMVYIVLLSLALISSDYLSNVYIILGKEYIITYVRVILSLFCGAYLYLYGEETLDFLKIALIAKILYVLCMLIGLKEKNEHSQ